MKPEELLAAAKNYSRMASQWFHNGEGALREKEKEIFTQAKLAAPGLKESVTDLTEVVRELRRNQGQIYEQLWHGLASSQNEDAPPPPDSPAGAALSAALRAMNDSIHGWLRLKDVFPESEDAILDMLVQLDRLRRAVPQKQKRPPAEPGAG